MDLEARSENGPGICILEVTLPDIISEALLGVLWIRDNWVNYVRDKG